MSDDFFDDQPGLIDEDPALDYIIYDKMQKEDRGQVDKNGGCLSVVALVILPVAFLVTRFWI